MSVNTSAQSVVGALTIETVPELFRNASSWFAGTGDMTIDLTQVERADSAGLALLVEWLRRAQDANLKLRFTNIPEPVQTLIRINGLQDALANHNT